MKRNLMLLAFLALVLALPQGSWAKVSGPCSDCHTMHNSQHGPGVNNDANTNFSGPMTYDGSTAPNRALTRGDCIACHTNQSGSSPLGGTSKNIPYVNTTSAPTYTFNGDSSNIETLAGGSFYWVADKGGNKDAKGHNVKDIAGQDQYLGYAPPGFDSSFSANGSIGTAWGTTDSGEVNQLTCAGAYGCHGKHQDDDQNLITDDYAAIRGAHHADDSTIDGSTVGKSFRFLYGIIGKEDRYWEYGDNAGHNTYYADDRTNFDYDDADSQTINYLCAECHGQFHSNTNSTSITNNSGSPWLRHPTDFALSKASSEKDYTSYPGPVSNNSYTPLVPVGVSDLNTEPSGSNGIVLCISCHRAHGSPYDDLLRWDYENCDTSASETDAAKCGCFACHTNKYSKSTTTSSTSTSTTTTP